MIRPDLVSITQDQFVADILTLRDRLTSARWTPDYLVGIGRGGLVPGAYLSHATGSTLLSIDHSSREPGFAGNLLGKLADKTIGGRSLLMVDDINDSGSTIAGLRKALAEAGAVEAHVRFAVLIHNVRSCAAVDYWAREIDRAHDKRWRVFPWEAMAPERQIVEDAAAMPDRLA